MEGATSPAPPPPAKLRRCGSPVGFHGAEQWQRARVPQSDEEARLSALPDDVLLYILVRVDLKTAARTGALSTRWRRLPWLLPELTIDVKDFISVPHSDEPIEPDLMHGAMLTLTAATKSLFAKPRRESIVTRLELKLYLVDTSSRDIGLLVHDAVDRGLLRDLDLAILDDTYPFNFYSEKGAYPGHMYPPTYSRSNMLRRARDLEGFFRAYPSVLHRLTSLSLYNVHFAQLETRHILFDCCKQLNHLTLSDCDAGDHSLWKIDAPNSKLSVLELSYCWFERIELIFLPKLEKLEWNIWKYEYAPLSFGFVPSLEELHLANSFDLQQNVLKLSEHLHGTTSIHTLTLDFKGENIWVQPEIKQLSSKFSKLRKLSVTGMFVEFGLLWTTVFLEAAPSVEILHIEVVEHACVVDVRQDDYGIRSSPKWELDSGGSKNLLLKELQIVGFRPLEQQLAFIRAMLERTPNLQAVVLKKDEECAAIALGKIPCASAGPAFPKNKDEQDTVVSQVTHGAFFSGRIILGD